MNGKGWGAVTQRRMRATYRLPCIVALAVLFLVHGSTTEAPDALFEVESLDSETPTLLRGECAP